VINCTWEIVRNVAVVRKKILNAWSVKKTKIINVAVSNNVGVFMKIYDWTHCLVLYINYYPFLYINSPFFDVSSF